MRTASPNKTTVIYHEGCHDGFAAAYAAWLRFGARADYIPARYGQRPPHLTEGSWVFVLDFFYPRDVTAGLAETNNLTVLDHHQTAEAELSGLPGCLVDTSKSGAMLAWEHFFPQRGAPRLFAYVQDADLWRWWLPDSKTVTAYISSLDMDFHTWHVAMTTMERDFDQVLTEGQPILRYQKKLIDQIAGRAVTQKVAGHRVPVVNTPILQSEVAHRLLDLHPNRPFAAVYSDNKNRRKWSLRSREDFDVATVAEQYGGGGHPGAAGFTHRVLTGSPKPPTTQETATP